MIYFTSDPHFFHNNIIRYCGRPFRNVKHMNSTIISNWNETVTEDDVVYVLGDFTMLSAEYTGRVEKILSKLNGTKHLILGNHDRLKPFTYTEIGFKTVHTALDLWIPEHHKRFLLTHDPVHSITIPNETWLVGHVHNMFKTLGNCINVGVDVWDFKPVSLKDIMIAENTLVE